MRQAVVLLKKVRRPATARLMSVLVGLRSSVVKRGNWTFRMSSGATFTYGTWGERTQDVSHEASAFTDGPFCQFEQRETW